MHHFSMTEKRVFQIIDQKIGQLEEIKYRNTVLLPSVNASIVTLQDLKRTLEEENEAPKPQLVVAEA